MPGAPSDRIEPPPGGAQPPVRLAGFAETRGFLFGYSQKCLVASLEIDPEARLDACAASLLASVERRLPDLAECDPPQGLDALEAGPAQLINALARIARAMQEFAGLAVCASGRVIQSAPSSNAPLGVQLFLPTLRPAVAAASINWAIERANALAAGGHGADDGLDTLMRGLRDAAPAGNNSRHIARAAIRLGIAHRLLPMGIFQFGLGARSRLFQSAASDATSAIGSILAKDKLLATGMLRAACICVPPNQAARSAEAAIAAAHRLGFPVVVKPVDQERGAGVTTGLGCEADVAKAFEIARAASPNVMVEKHVEGREYRLLVVNGELLWAFERVPAGVTGDGKMTIAALIEAENARRHDGPSQGRRLRKIEVDEVVHANLARQGLALGTVPAAGTRVQLRNLALVDDGGEVIAAFDTVHRDNAIAAERAARLLRLDIAGIDFLSPDISRSWREVGGAITEVNAQPQFSPLSRADIYEVILKKLVVGEGRIPVALVIGEVTAEFETQLRGALAAGKVRAGIASKRQITIGPDTVSPAGLDPYQAADILAGDTSVEAIVLIADAGSLNGHGMPLDRIDLLVIADAPDASDGLLRALNMARAHLAGSALVARDNPVAGAASTALGSGRTSAVEAGELAATLCSSLIDLAQAL